MPTTKEVRRALAHLNTVETETSELANGLRVTVGESDVGEFMKTLRVRGFNANTRRIGDTLVSHIEAEESGGLGDLFSR